MGGKARPKPTFRLDRIAASADSEGLSPEQMAPLIDSALDRHIGLGTIREDEREAWQRYMTADLTGGAEALAQREAELQAAMAQRADANGAMRCSGRLSDGEQLIAAAVRDGKFAESRREHWRQRLAADPQSTRVLLTAPPDQGGLTPLLAASSRRPSPEQERAVHERAFAASFPSQARELGYPIERAHPLNPALPGIAEPAREGPRTKIVDRS